VQLLPGWNICEAKGARVAMALASTGTALAVNAPRRKSLRVVKHSLPKFDVRTLATIPFSRDAMRALLEQHVITSTL